MSITNENSYHKILAELSTLATLVAVSKTRPAADVKALYDQGQRDFGENYVQELTEKQSQLPADIRWHFIGHLQSNKVKYIISFVHLIQSVDSMRLLKEIDRQARAKGRVVDVLLQVHIAREETKFGFDAPEVDSIMQELKANPLSNVQVRGLMGMASFSDDTDMVSREFSSLKTLFDRHFPGGILSMGMSGDYTIALAAGSNMVRIGSLLFGKRG